MKRLVEGMLPAEVLLKQGIYLQSCAHIELALWHIVQLSDGHDLGLAPDMPRYYKLKKSTVPLIDGVRAAVSKMPAALGIELAVLIREVDEGRENRNMAAHGAWYMVPGGKLEVEHYIQKPSPSGPVWHFIDQKFQMKMIDLAVEDVDRLLRKAIFIRDTLQTLVDHRRFRNVRIGCKHCVQTILRDPLRQ